jgi:hypothetical protein
VSTAGRSCSVLSRCAIVSGFAAAVSSTYTATWTFPVICSITRSISLRISSASPNRNSAMNAVDTAPKATVPFRRIPAAVSRK